MGFRVREFRGLGVWGVQGFKGCRGGFRASGLALGCLGGLRVGIRGFRVLTEYTSGSTRPDPANKIRTLLGLGFRV